MACNMQVRMLVAAAAGFYYMYRGCDACRMMRMIDRLSHASFTVWRTTTEESSPTSPLIKSTTTATTTRHSRQSAVYREDDEEARRRTLRKLYVVDVAFQQSTRNSHRPTAIQSYVKWPKL